MRHRIAIGFASTVGCSMLLASSVRGQASFTGMGDLPGGSSFSVANAVSGDGSTVVGLSASASGFEAVRWKPGNLITLGMVDATAVSFDGTVIVGRIISGVQQAARWVEGSGVQPLGSLAPGTSSVAFGVSADGQIVVGISTSLSPGPICNPDAPPPWFTPQAFRWTVSGGMAGLGFPASGANPQSYANCISNDGTIIGGQANVDSDCANSSDAYAVAWINGAAQFIGATGLEGTGRVQDVSPDGVAFVGDDFNGPFIIINGTPVGSIKFVPSGVSAGGARVIGSNFAGSQALLWEASSGVRSIQEVLVNEFGLGAELLGWTLTHALGISDDGSVIVGRGIHNGVTEGWVAVLPKDTDGDGLLDDWEDNGVPYTDTLGRQQRYLLDIDEDGNSDADPYHKDLFVEVDAMDGPGLAPSLSDLAPVIDAFASAPILNPDGTPGIRLHVHIDETSIGTIPMPSPWVEFDQIKSQVASGTTLPGYFGTVDDRNHADGSARLDARRKAFRYCLFANTILGSTISGIAELPGNDFIVSLGGWSTPGGTSADKAGTFMHELGHTLGLGHGGRDPITGPDHTQFKPNYYSVMNYDWQTPKPWHAPNTWPLSPGRPGYSDVQFGDLDESALVECTGLVASSGFAQVLIAHNTHNSPADPVNVANNWTCCAIDWNDDGMIGCFGETVAVDLNRRTNSDPHSPGEVLKGREDWSQLIYDFKTSPDFADGRHQTSQNQPPELTLEENEALAKILPPFCLGDTNLDRAVDVVDLLAVINNWAATGGTPADTNGDGTVNVVDLLTVINAWGQCR
nr:hypothetical protein [uncultured bacterium]